MQLLTRPDLDKPDGFILTAMHCHCTKGWRGERCTDYHIDTDEILESVGIEFETSETGLAITGQKQYRKSINTAVIT